MPEGSTRKHLTRAGGLALLACAAQAVESEQYLKGELLFEGINQRNYRSGNDEVRDRSAQMWMRARFGAKAVLQENVRVQATFVYDAEAGDDSVLDSADDREEVRVDDAYVLLKSFLHEDLHVRVGRQPISYNLRTDRGAFLFDSRSHVDVEDPRPTVTGWDGVTGYFQRDQWNLKFIPFVYILDETREGYGAIADPISGSTSDVLYGLTIDWKPDGEGDDRLFMSGTIAWEEDPFVGDALGGIGRGEELLTYYIGATIKLDRGFEVWAEGAFQSGDLDDDTEFKGFGVSAGVDWAVPGAQDAIVAIQYDFLSGDDDPADGDYEAFVNTWEGVSDTLIVEHERYGEIGELVVGNMQAFKASMEWGFYENRLAVKLIGARYTLNEEVAGEDDFGLEFDLSLDFQYNDYTRITLFGGAFLPGEAYEEAASLRFGTDTKDDPIQIYGASLQVLF